MIAMTAGESKGLSIQTIEVISLFSLNSLSITAPSDTRHVFYAVGVYQIIFLRLTPPPPPRHNDKTTKIWRFENAGAGIPHAPYMLFTTHRTPWHQGYPR